VYSMRATLNIADNLIEEVQRLSGVKSKTKAIETAMTEYIRQKKVEQLLALRGTINVDYDWEAEEEREMAAQEERERFLEGR
jgi:metal-responsive CopG/Arc/MetJ family transcriptional regulator